MEEGFIPLRRSFFTHYLWEEKRIYSRAEAWLDLIHEAAWKGHKKLIAGKLIEVSRGEVVASVRFLSDRWKWSNTKVCQFLEMLREDGSVETEKRQGITVVLLLNYERFNPLVSTEEKTEKRRGYDGETTQRRRGNAEIKEGEEGKQVPSINEQPRAQDIPTLAQVLAEGQNIGCSKEEAERFFNHFESVGWVNKHGQPILNYQTKLAAWWVDSSQRNNKKTNGTHQQPHPNGARWSGITDRNEGTANAGNTNDYSRVGK